MFKLTRSHNWLIFSLINHSLEKRIKKYCSGRLIDIGCGIKPYFEMTAPYVDEHIGVDHVETFHDRSNIDIFGSAYKMSVESEDYDTVLCTDVLEHLEEPGKAITEACRVLKPGGYAIYTVPLFWHLHEEPRDFYRYTKYGLHYLFEKNGFELVEIKALSGFFVTFAQELVYYIQRFRRGGKVNPMWWLVPIISFFIQLSAYLLNKIDNSEEFTIEYIIVARKPIKQ